MTDTAPRARGWISKLAKQCWAHRRLVVVTLGVTLIAVAVDLIAPLLAKAAIDHATGESEAGWSLTTIVIALLVAALVRYACQFGRRLTAGELSIKVQNDLRLRLLDTLLHVDGAAQNEIRTGQIVSRSISDLQIIQGLLAMVPLSVGAAVQIVLAIAIMAYLSPLLTLVALAVIPIVGLVVFVMRRNLFAATWAAQQAAADVAGHVEETVTGVRVVKAFGQEQRAVDELVGLGGTLYRLRLRAARINARFAPTMAAIPQLGMVAVIALGGLLTMRGAITPGTFLAFATYVASMAALARMLTNLIVNAQLARAAVERVQDVIEHPLDPSLDADGAVPDGPLGIAIDDISVRLGSRDVLDGLTLHIAPGECVAVIGPPGSGKSTLADVLGRHHRPHAGSVALVGAHGRADLDEIAPTALHHAVSVVFDEPFLYSDTIASNITLGDDTPDPDRMRTAAARADALEFIEELPDGFDAVVGERGLTLSGGQRQRVALARALYSGGRVLVLDDATSAVDATTEANILHELRADRPTMLVLAHRRSTLVLADRVAILEDGRITDIGTPAELEDRSARFRSLMASADPDEVAADVLSRHREVLSAPVSPELLWPDIDAPDTSSARAVSSTAPGGGGMGGGGMGGGGGRGGGMSALGSMSATPELLAAVDRLPPAEEDPKVDVVAAQRENPTFSLWSLLRPVRLLLILAMLAIGIDTLVGLAFPSLARTAIDAASTTDETTLWWALGIGVALVALGWVASATTTLTATRAGERVLYGLRVRSYAHLQRLGLDYYEREMSGRIMTRMTTDVDALSAFLQTGLANAIVAALTLLGVSAALIATDPLLGVLMLPVLPVLIAATVVFRRFAAPAYTRSRELISAVNADFQENIAGIKTTQAYNHVDQAGARFTGRTLAWVRSRMRSQRAIAVYFPFITFVADIATAIAVAVGAHQVASGTVSPGTLVAFILYLSMLFGPVQQLSQVFDGYQQASVGLSRIADLLRTPTTVADRRHATVPPHLEATVDFHDVGFRYQGTDTDALSDVDLHIPAGSSLALVGRTGAGKSTIVKLLARFYDPTDGAVRVDGTDVRDFTIAGYRARLGVVGQEPHLFVGTVADNIAYGRPGAARSRIEAAAAAVGATKMIAGLDGGMYHPIGERGAGLSSGQRQLLALARAELVEPDLLILDEATATLDQETETMVLAAGEAVTARRTSVIVAHRLTTAARADRIAVVDGGRIVESGTHRELLALNGRYRRFWDAGVDPAEGLQSHAGPAKRPR